MLLTQHYALEAFQKCDLFRLTNQSLDVAEHFCKLNGLTCRVVWRDGEPVEIYCDSRRNRVNVCVWNNWVIGIESIG